MLFSISIYSHGIKIPTTVSSPPISPPHLPYSTLYFCRGLPRDRTFWKSTIWPLSLLWERISSFCGSRDRDSLRILSFSPKQQLLSWSYGEPFLSLLSRKLSMELWSDMAHVFLGSHWSFCSWTPNTPLFYCIVIQIIPVSLLSPQLLFTQRVSL